MPQIVTDADAETSAVRIHLGVLHDAARNMRAAHNDLHHRVEALENPSENASGNETTSLVYCHVDCGDFGNKSPPGAVLNAQWAHWPVPFLYTVEESTPGIYESATGRFTPGVAGVYKVTATVEVYYVNNRGTGVLATLHKNNTAPNATHEAPTRIATGGEWQADTYVEFHGAVMRADVDWVGSLTSTDYLQLFFFSQNTFGDRPFVRARTKFILHKIG